MPWYVPSARTIFERIAAALEQGLAAKRPDVDPAAISRAARSNHGLLSIINRPVALEAREIHDHVAYYGRQVFIDTADDEYIERHAEIWGIRRRPATKAIGAVTIEAEPDTAIPMGMELSAPAGLIFVTTETADSGESGRVDVAVEAQLSGPAGNLAAGTILKTVEPFPAIKTVTVAEPGLAGGADAESWQDVRDAVLARIRQPPHGGAAFDYQQWLRTKFDVRAVAVIPDWIGRGSVGVIVAMHDGGNGRPPLDAEVEAMMEYLGPPGSSKGVRPVTAYVVIVPAKSREIPITVRLRPDTVATRKAIVEAWTAFVLTIGDDHDNFNDGPIGATIERSRIIGALSAADGEYAHDLIEPATSIKLDRNEYPVAGPVTFAGPE